MSGGGGSRRRSRRGRRGTHLLDAVADRGELVREVLAAGVGRVEVALDDEGEAAAHDTVAVLAAQRRLHARHALCKRKESTVSARGGGAGWRAASAPYGTRCIRRTSKRTSSHSTTCKRESESKRVCSAYSSVVCEEFKVFAHRPFDLEEGQADRRLPVLGAFEDQVVERVAAAERHDARQWWQG